MKPKITLKTKSVYLGLYTEEDGSYPNWFTFIYSSHATDSELKVYFLGTVLPAEYGDNCGISCDDVGVYELREVFDYTTKKHKTIII